MPNYVYRPDCYLANKRGMVEKNDEYYMWLSVHTVDNRMMDGNRVVEVRFIPDEMPATRHMINGRMYTSKKKFRDETKARGCIEVGNDYARKPKPHKVLSRRERREDIKRAMYEIRNGRDIMKEIR